MGLVSVVIPTKNRQELLLEVLPTCLTQKDLGEVIVINDGSSDNTSEQLERISKRSPKLKSILLSTSMGAPYCRNIGIQKARHPFIYIGEDDLYLKPNTLSKLISHLDKNHADIISGRRISILPDETEREALERANADDGQLVNTALITTNCQIRTARDINSDLLDASMLIKKTVFNKVKYDPSYKKNAYREETDFQLTSREAGYALIHCPHVVTYHLPKLSKIGGNHGANTVLYETEVIKNDYYFFRKHEIYLRSNFHIGFYSHMLKFIFYRLYQRNIQPFILNLFKFSLS